MSRSRQWSPFEDGELIAAWDAEVTIADICRSLRRSVGAVYDRARYLRLSSRSSRPKERDGAGDGMNADSRAAIRGATPEMVVNRDAEHVALCLSQGGFPDVRLEHGKPVWVWPKRRAA